MPNKTNPLKFNFDNSLVRELSGFYVKSSAEHAQQPMLVKLNDQLAKQFNLPLDGLTPNQLAQIFSGNQLPIGAEPVAQAYSGHQFGHFSPQLGDGRALLVGELLDKVGKRFDLQLKGSGKTPFSRGGDGKSALAPVLREYIISEAMHKLNVPTTRALAAVTTGDNVCREKALAGGVFARIASSHVRVGTFQFFAARGELDKVKQLADYVINRHYPKALNASKPYLAMFEMIVSNQANLIAKWMLTGFVHGVMNTDNMTITGETIDYGPCAFMDIYNPETVFSSIDKNGRYAYKNQPNMALWNLARLAECLLPLINTDDNTAIEIITIALNQFTEQYKEYWLNGMRKKLGLTTKQPNDMALAEGFLSVLQHQNIDYTNSFRNLTASSKKIMVLFNNTALFKQWYNDWKNRCDAESMSGDAKSILSDERVKRMNAANPIYIPRNHLVEAALKAATSDGDYSQFEKLISVLENPFKQRQGLEKYAAPAPQEFGNYKSFCGT